MYSVFLLGPLSRGTVRNPVVQGSTRRMQRGRKSQKKTIKVYIIGPKNQHKSPSLSLAFHTVDVEGPSVSMSKV